MASKTVMCVLKSGMQTGRVWGWFRTGPRALCWRDELAWEGPGKAGHSVYASRDCSGEGSKTCGNKDVTPTGHEGNSCSRIQSEQREKNSVVRR